MKIKATAAAILMIPMIASAAETVLWPGDAKAELKAQPSSTLAFAADGTALVDTGVKYTWPGVRLDFKGNRDLSKFGSLVFAVSNRLDRKVTVMVSVKCRNYQGKSPGGQRALRPHEAANLVVNLSPMPWQLDKPCKFIGMNGYPAAGGVGDGVFDVSNVASIHIFVTEPSSPHAFALSKVTAGGAPTKAKLLKTDEFFPFVDRYGQFKHDEWPGKVHSDKDLKDQAAEESVWLRNHEKYAIPDCDEYGGWTKGPKLKATGFFRTEKVNGKWWLVDPNGYLFFSHGVTCINSGEGVTAIGHRENYFEELPDRKDKVFGRFYGKAWHAAAKGFYSQTNNVPFDLYNIGAANMVRKYGKDWSSIAATLAHRRLHAWGLNTVANWSQYQVYSLRKTPYTVTFGTGGMPRLEKSGGWWGKLPDPFHPDFEKTLRQRARQVAKQMKDDPWCLGVFVDNELAWNRNCDLENVADCYFKKVAKVVHEEIPNHLYLGSRIAGGPDETLAIAAKYCDVVSANVYRHMMDRDLPAGSVDKPMINGEYHFGALDRGMFHTGLVATDNQADRAECYKRYVNSCLDHPRFVGTHWFQWKDQPLTGRGDGENYQIGFLNIVDNPNTELVNASREIGRTMYERRFNGPKKPKVAQNDLNYWCTWGIQGSTAKKSKEEGIIQFDGDQGGTTMQRANLNEKTLFGPKGWATTFFPRIRKDMYLLLDDGWDVPPITLATGTNMWMFSRCYPDPERFPSLTGSEGERLCQLNERVKSCGWKGLALWIACHCPGESGWNEKTKSFGFFDDAKCRASWAQRMRWSKEAGVRYWKVDWGVHASESGFRQLMSEVKEEVYPELVLEHCWSMKPLNGFWPQKDGTNAGPRRLFGDERWEALRTRFTQILASSDVFRTYDFMGGVGIATTLERLAYFSQIAEASNMKVVFNVENLKIVAATLGYSVGMMENWDPKDPVRYHDMFYRWQKIAPPYGHDLGIKTYYSKESLEEHVDVKDSWYTPCNNSRVSQIAPAEISRGIELPKFKRMLNKGLRPYAAVGRYPNGALALATFARTHGDRKAEKGLAEYEVDAALEKGKPCLVSAIGQWVLKGGLVGGTKVMATGADGKKVDVTDQVVKNADGSVTLKVGVVRSNCDIWCAILEVE